VTLLSLFHKVLVITSSFCLCLSTVRVMMFPASQNVHQWYSFSQNHYIPGTKSRQTITNILRQYRARDMVGRWKCLFSLSGICSFFLSINFLGGFQLQFSVGNQNMYELHRGFIFTKWFSSVGTASFLWRNGLSKLIYICVKFHVWDFELNVKAVVLYTKTYLPLC